MSQRIDQDHGRFRKIVRGKIRENLRKYISQGDLEARQGGKSVSVPLPKIDIPRFTHGNQDGQQGVGQGDGQVGDGEGKPGDGKKAGDSPGQHDLEVDVSLEELAEILGEALELPNIEPKGDDRLRSAKYKFSSIRNQGPNALRHFRRTYQQALKRQIAMGLYDGKKPVVVPMRDDVRYRAWKRDPLPDSSAVIFYMMDVSGSMGDEQKQIVRTASFWIDTWLRSQYDGIETRYLIHDAQAKEVDQDTFFRTKESGGTMISTVYSLCSDIIAKEYDPNLWNIYPFQFSDGDNWSVDDTTKCMSLLKERILPVSNLFCYGQVDSPYGSGQFLKDLETTFSGDESALICAEIQNREGIMDAIKTFLGRGS